ncbi:MAG: glucose-6-phosphate isomerase [Spirochaetaceae bacterium]|jgi:glucose-6-phosphate isomerase|nr:glucose-6-phosphate isomerase [Spirochaetaceae bacterium]
MEFIDLDKTASYAKLLNHALREYSFDYAKLDAGRVARCLIPAGGGLMYSWAAKAVDEPEIKLLQALADEQDLIGKYRMLLDGEYMNTGEHRRVLHHLLRGRLGKPVIHQGKDLEQFYSGELERVAAFADRVSGGELRGGSGKPFSAAVQIGIGGSDLGPRALYLALENWAIASGRKNMDAAFISNVDPDDGAKVVSSLDLERTLFILVSKSGTTQETLANELFVRDRLKKAGLDPAKHLVAITSETSPLARNPAYLDSFYMDDFIGGRYSSSSPAGGVILSLAFGSRSFREFLDGAHEADKLALESRVTENASLLAALIGVWERNLMGYTATAALPYSQALSRFPAHLQQLDMESNGKRVNRDGRPIAYATGPLVFGEPGTNGQHSFYQLLHQGTDTVPLEFIGFLESQRGEDIEAEGSTSQTKLKANLAAQIVAFARGRKLDHSQENFTREFPGGRPSSLIYGKKAEPRSLGALLAHFENKVMFQGFLWNINSFDQEGVQLGKELTKKALASGSRGSSGDSALDAYLKLLGIQEES